MDKKLQKTFNDQIKHELYSAYIYLAMAAYFETKNLPGFANWMKIQYKEEVAHAMKMFEFLNDRGVRVVLQAIPQPTLEFSSSLEVFEETLKTDLIGGLIVEIGGLVIDGTLKNKLRRILPYFKKN